MEWLTENWFWVLIGVLFVGVHMFGHGGHGGGSSHGVNDAKDRLGTGTGDTDKPSGHRH
jgi:hypothetical protein